MEKKVTNFIRMNNLITKGTTVAIGVSGGADSLALFHYFIQRKDQWQLQLIAIHIDHMFRGEQSNQDRIFVEQLCRQYDITCESTAIDVATYQAHTGKTTQVAARDVRYQFYEQVMKKHQAHTLALGHHGDDQVETILMRITRGAKGSSYGGMKVQRPFATGVIVRPFLCVTKQEIEKYCQENQLTPRIDPSNLKDVYTRNRFRKILPILKQENPLVHEKFLQFSTMLMEDEEFLQEQAVAEMNRMMTQKEENTIIIRISSFQFAPKTLQRRIIQLILDYLYKNVIPASLSFIHVVQIMSFFEGTKPQGELHFPNGLRIVRTYDNGIFTFSQAVQKEEKIIQLSFLTDTMWHEGIFTVQILSHRELPDDKSCFICPLTSVQLPIVVRTRKNGDKMTIKGMKGTKKIKDIFIDSKIPKKARDEYPVVVDSKGEILWLPNIKKSAFEGVTAESYLVIFYKTENQRRTMEEKGYNER